MFWLIVLAFILWSIASAYGWAAAALAVVLAVVTLLAVVDLFGDNASSPRERRP